MKLPRFICTLIALFVYSSARAEDNKLTVFAAASLTNALGEISSQYEKEKLVKVVQSYAASSTLAKQIENGAPADVFVSADTKWMDYLQDKQRIDPATRSNLLGNKLVLIAPKGKAIKVEFMPAFDFAKAFDGRLCTGDVESVPVGIYAKQALTNLNWWNNVKMRIVGAQDVRAALAFVERGECALGIVYETDAKITNKVEIVGTFPAESHSPVIYPVALVAGAKNADKAYLEYLKSTPASAVFRKYGFTPLNDH